LPLATASSRSPLPCLSSHSLKSIAPKDATLGNVIVDNQTALFAFGLSFAVIANYWTIHHSILQHCGGTTRASSSST
jgi:uncharacterized membrane protein